MTIVPIATSLYTYAEGGYVKSIAVRHYDKEALFIKGYAGRAYNLGTGLRALIAQGGRDMASG